MSTPEPSSSEHKDSLYPFESPEITNPAILGLDSILKSHLVSLICQRKILSSLLQEL